MIVLSSFDEKMLRKINDTNKYFEDERRFQAVVYTSVLKKLLPKGLADFMSNPEAFSSYSSVWIETEIGTPTVAWIALHGYDSDDWSFAMMQDGRLVAVEIGVSASHTNPVKICRTFSIERLNEELDAASVDGIFRSVVSGVSDNTSYWSLSNVPLDISKRSAKQIELLNKLGL